MRLTLGVVLLLFLALFLAVVIGEGLFRVRALKQEGLVRLAGTPALPSPSVFYRLARPWEYSGSARARRQGPLVPMTAERSAKNQNIIEQREELPWLA
jgi:hypothetical protein